MSIVHYNQHMHLMHEFDTKHEAKTYACSNHNDYGSVLEFVALIGLVLESSIDKLQHCSIVEGPKYNRMYCQNLKKNCLPRAYVL
jgi:TnpA family transposase